MNPCNRDSASIQHSRRNEYSKQELYAKVTAHLRGHGLTEPKTAIRKYAIVSEATEIVIPPRDQQRLPTEEWTDRDDTWLPDGVRSPGDGPLSAPDSPGETSSD